MSKTPDQTELTVFDVAAAWNQGSKNKSPESTRGEVIDPAKQLPPSVPEDLARLAIFGAAAQAQAQGVKMGAMAEAKARDDAAAAAQTTPLGVLRQFFAGGADLSGDNVPPLFRYDAATQPDLVDKGVTKAKSGLGRLLNVALSAVVADYQAKTKK